VKKLLLFFYSDGHFMPFESLKFVQNIFVQNLHNLKKTQTQMFAFTFQKQSRFNAYFLYWKLQFVKRCLSVGLQIKSTWKSSTINLDFKYTEWKKLHLIVKKRVCKGARGRGLFYNLPSWISRAMTVALRSTPFFSSMYELITTRKKVMKPKFS